MPRLCRHEGKEGAQADLKTLKAAVDYWNKEYGPLTVVPTYWRPKDNPPKERWLTKSEAARLLRAAKPYPYLRRAILLQLYTGSRPGFVQAIRWQIDFASGVIYRVSRGAPQGEKKRSPPARLGNRIKAHLKRWRRLDGKNANHICHVNGHAVRDPHTAWRKVIRAAGLKGVTRHTLRHTRATWMMQAGVSIWEAAGFLGMTVKTLQAVYGHHSPDHQERAANI